MKDRLLLSRRRTHRMLRTFGPPSPSPSGSAPPSTDERKHPGRDLLLEAEVMSPRCVTMTDVRIVRLMVDRAVNRSVKSSMTSKEPVRSSARTTLASIRSVDVVTIARRPPRPLAPALLHTPASADDSYQDAGIELQTGGTPDRARHCRFAGITPIVGIGDRSSRFNPVIIPAP